MYTLVSIADLPDSGLFQPLGAVLFNEDSYVETVKLIELTGVPYTDYTPGERWAFDWKSGEAELIPPAPQEFAELVAVEYQRYSEFWNEVYLPFSEIGYKVLVIIQLFYLQTIRLIVICWSERCAGGTCCPRRSVACREWVSGNRDTHD